MIPPLPLRFTILSWMAVATLACGTAKADEALYLTWNECWQAGPVAAPSNIIPACGVDTQVNRLFCAFTMAARVDSVLGIEAVVDLQVDQPAGTGLLAWWKLAPGECRDGSLRASQDYSTFPACADPWQNPLGPSTIAAYREGQPGSGVASRARIVVVAGITSAQDMVTLLPGVSYNAVEITLDNANGGLCPGCSNRTCLVLNSIWLRRGADTSRDVLLTMPGPNAANWASWQDQKGSDCAAVPVRRATWGRLKSLYR